MIATYHATQHSIDARIYIESESSTERSIAVADELAAQFPKSARVRSTTLSRPIDDSYLNGSETIGMVALHVELKQTQTTGEYNEAGLRRWHAFKRTLERLDIELEYRTPYSNSLSAADAAAL